MGFMKKYNKYIASILVVTLSILLLAGCGTNQEAGTGGGTQGKGTELTFIIWDTNQAQGMQDMIDAYKEIEPDVTVKLEVVPWDEYWMKLQASATGGNMPDIFWMHPEMVYVYTEGEALMDMSTLIPESDIDLGNYPEFIGAGFNIDGGQYAIPKDYSTLALWYNKDLFDAAGVSYPDDTWTWEDWYNAAGELTNPDEDVYGSIAQANSQDYYYNLVWSNGGDIVNAEETKSLYGEQNVIDALEFGYSFIESGYAPTTADLTNTTAYQRFESGKVAMILAGSWYAIQFLDVDGLNIDVAPIPLNKEGGTRGTACGGMGYSIAANTKYPDEAWGFVEYLGSYEANVIQAQSGAAISAFEGSGEEWTKGFPQINAQVFVDAAEYGFSTQYVPSRAEWRMIEEDWMSQVFDGTVPVAEGATRAAEEIQLVLDEYNANR